ncbi:FCD domain-containing protein, partial [Arthrobacter sp.]
EEHRAIVQALLSGDPDQAAAASRAHLESTLSALNVPHVPGLPS